MKANRNIITDNRAQVNIIILAIFTVIMGFGMLTVGTYLYYAIASNADAGTKIAVVGQYASGNFNISGNVSNGDMANITNGAALYMFEFNTTSPSPSACQMANCIIVNVYNSNDSLRAATNLTAAINANATLSPLVTASTTAGSNGYNFTSISADTRGTAANSYSLAKSGTNIAFSGATLSGGVNDVTGQTSQNSLNNYVSVTFPLFGLALMILGFGVIFITLRRMGFGGEVR
jgi:hypothetical protein